MWYEYIIIYTFLAMAAAFVLWVMFKSFSGKTHPCGSESCGCHAHDEKQDDSCCNNHEH